MRIAVVGHSLAHIRQQSFFKQLAIMGHDVLLICPDKWGTLKPEPYKMGYNGERSSSFEICPLPAPGAPDMYRFKLNGFERIILAWSPDVLYVQQEVECEASHQAAGVSEYIPKAVFVWENLRPPVNSFFIQRDYGLVVCGNDSAAKLHPHFNQLFLPQVGVDTLHFTARPEVERSADVGFIGRPVREKGVYDLQTAWPLARITPWTEWLKLPWALSGIKVIVCPSRDTEFWHEQAGPYAAWEAMSCGCAVVVSDAGAIPWWNKGGYCEPCQSLVMVHQGDSESLRRGITEALADWEARGKANRAWVEEHLGTAVVGNKLSKALEAL